MRLAFAGGAVLAAYACLAHVTYLNTGGYSEKWPEYRRIDVVSAADCSAVLQRAKVTLGDDAGFSCESVPLYRHWSNMVRSAYDRGGASSVAELMFGGEAVASVAQSDATVR